MKNKAPRSLEGQVALVTGATRGIGKGIALQLGEARCTVYITGRTLKSTNGSGSLEETAQEIERRGGVCIPVQVDHENDYQVAELFKKISQEQNGQLDILVNNAFKAGTTMVENRNTEFWQMKPEIWDEYNNVGLRNHYMCTVYAARLMVPRKTGLIVFVSSMGGLFYFGNVAYGVGKQAIDRMAVDCGIELKKHNVTCLSLCVGAVRTELLCEVAEKIGDDEIFLQNVMGRSVNGRALKYTTRKAESTEFTGRVIVGLACERKLIKYTSRVIIAADYAQSRKIRDIDNRIIPSARQINNSLDILLPDNLKFLSRLVPNFVKVPSFLITLFASKF